MFCNIKFKSLKGETEAEGLSHSELAAEAIIAAKHSLGYLVKISGAEALGDVRAIQKLGIDKVVCPMIETEFAMSKYMAMISDMRLKSVGVTIETKTAVENIDEILDAGSLLTEVTIGRSDLCASLGGISVEAEQTIKMVKHVARKAKIRGLSVTMGGSVSQNTVQILQTDHELFECIDFVETRKVVINKEHFVREGTLDQVFDIEKFLLNVRLGPMALEAEKMNKRLTAIEERR